MTTRRTIRWGAAAVRVATILTGVMACLWGGMPLLAQDGTPKGPAAAAGEMRTWTDMTGKVSREAEFLKAEDGQVHLRLKGGEETKIPLNDLSKKDRDWVRNEGAVERVAVHFHLVADMEMAKGGVAMTNWLTPEMIATTVMPEVNRIWSPAKIEWTLSGVTPGKTRSEGRAATIATLLAATRDSEGEGDPERIRKLEAILHDNRNDPRAINIYVIPYLGGTSQGNAQPGRRRVFLGQWTDKPSRGERPPEKCLLVEGEPFQQGSFARTVAHEVGHILGLKHPEKNVPPFERLMGGKNPAYDLTAEEKATARKTARTLVSTPR